MMCQQAVITPTHSEARSAVCLRCMGITAQDIHPTSSQMAGTSGQWWRKGLERDRQARVESRDASVYHKIGTKRRGHVSRRGLGDLGTA